MQQDGLEQDEDGTRCQGSSKGDSRVRGGRLDGERGLTAGGARLGTLEAENTQVRNMNGECNVPRQPCTRERGE